MHFSAYISSGMIGTDDPVFNRNVILSFYTNLYTQILVLAIVSLIEYTENSSLKSLSYSPCTIFIVALGVGLI